MEVVTDYILGLTPVSVSKRYDISELGLSNEAVKGLVTGAVDVQILNRLLEHRDFPKLIDLIRVYFQDTAAKGIMARNQIIEMATASLSDLVKEHTEYRAEEKPDLQRLNAQKIGEHEAEIEKTRMCSLPSCGILKKDMDSGGQPGEVATAAMLQTMRDALAGQQQKPVSMDDVTRIIAGQIGQLIPMDEETAEQFRQLAKKMMEQAAHKMRRNHERCSDPEQRSRAMSHIKGKDISIEILLRKAFWRKGIRYWKNYKKLPGTPDITITKYKIAIFCDSEFFHGYNWEIKKQKLGYNWEYWIKKLSATWRVIGKLISS